MNEFYYLSHGGPGSGRYPLGSGERPYQKFEGSRRKSSGIVGYIQSRKEKKAEAQREKAAIEARKKAAEDAEKKRQHEADKERVLRAGTASEVMRYQGELTNRELQDAFNRIDLERKLSSFSAQEIKSGMEKFDKVMQNLKTVNNWASIGTDTWNLMASIYNATPEGQKNPWATIKKGDGGGGKKK